MRTPLLNALQSKLGACGQDNSPDPTNAVPLEPLAGNSVGGGDSVQPSTPWVGHPIAQAIQAFRPIGS